jgi:uncharacterized protein YjbI with pentapeptide repeats
VSTGIRSGYKSSFLGGETTQHSPDDRGQVFWEILSYTRYRRSRDREVGALLIPVVIALGTGWITWRLAMIENERAEAERELAEQRAQDEALQTYLDEMSTLLLERDLRTSEADSEVRTLARARTLTVLERLDTIRKTAVMQFLDEARLVRGVDGRDPVIALTGADLRSADLRSADLDGADLYDADLRGADLTIVHLRGAFLHDADLRGSNLTFAYLNGANLTESILSGADLNEADLSRAVLYRADLSGAVLLNVDLSDAGLDDANLRGAEGITNEELERQAASLEGATMPNGQKYEDWLKSKDSGEDRENSGPS